jgi:FKBP-type peptidyl-prolyl cis-trans isomerase SlpA
MGDCFVAIVVRKGFEFMSAELPLVEAGSFLTLHYRLSGPDGQVVINTFEGQPATLSLGAGELAEALESRLMGLVEGTEASFEVPAGSAFGEHNPDLLRWVSRATLNEHGDPAEAYNPGDVVRFPGPTGQGAYAGVVRESTADNVLFDFNHPLAGVAVKFDVKVIGVL